MDIKIEKGVPIPVIDVFVPPIKKALLSMQVGDSFYTEESQLKVDNWCGLVQPMTGYRFLMQKEGAGFRVWRLA
jgi:hypothetical protein